MNFQEIQERQRRRRDAILDRFLTEGTQSAQVQARLRQEAEAAVKARQDAAFNEAVMAEIKITKAPEADDMEVNEI